MRLVAATLTGASLALLALLSSFQTIGIGSGLVEGGVPIALAAPETVAVGITEDGFDPSTVTVAVGGTISWTNGDAAAHSVVGEPGSGLESPAFERWGMYSRTFHTAGTIAYHDGLNPDLTGIINVVEGDESSPAPGQAPPNSGTDASPLAGIVTIDAGTDWFGNSGFQNGVYETTIQAGDTVRWNIVEAVHTVYECGDNWSGANSCTSAAWNSDILSAPATFSQQFDTAGTYYYLCTLHPLSMRGAITVQGSAPPAAPDTGPPAAPDSGPAAPAPDGSNAPSAPSGPEAAPSAGFGPPSDPSGLGDYLPLSMLVMAAAGLTFLGSSVMLIKQRVSGAQAAVVDGWTPTMIEPPQFPQERADAQPSAAAGGARLSATPTLQPWRTRGQMTGHAAEPRERPTLEPDDFEALRTRLASINARFARIVRKVERQ